MVKKLKKKSVVMRALTICQKFLRRYLDYPDRKWPCYICGRDSLGDPPLLIRVTKHSGETFTAGCYLCSNYDLANDAKKLVDLAIGKLV